MFLGQLRGMFKRPEEEEEELKERTPKVEKSSDADSFMQTLKVKDFVKKWSKKKSKKGEKPYTKRGISALLRALFQISSLGSDQEVLDLGEEILEKLGGMDKLEGFLMGWKAKSEGIMKSLKSIVGGK